MNDITVCVATIPPRAKMLRRALASVVEQTLSPAEILVEYDHHHDGPAAVRNRMLDKVSTEWVAWLDDDDQLRPQHLELLRAFADEAGADVVYPWFEVVSSRSTPGWDPLGRFGVPFDAAELRERNYIPVTLLARTKLVIEAGGFVNRSDGDATCEDWGCWLGLLDAGATFAHLPVRTWIWNWHDGNTSGRSDRW